MTRNSTRGARQQYRKGGSSSGSGSGSNSAATLEEPLLPNAQGNGHAERRTWFPPSFCRHPPLSDQATFCFLKQTADTSVMGLLTLSTLYATYLLAWGKSGSACIPEKVSTDLSWVQIVFGSLPFAIFPTALYVSGIVQAAETDRHALGIPATLCLIEFIAAIALGGGMMFCVSGWWWLWCVAAVVVIMVIMLLTWGLTLKHPKGLRSFIWSTCFRQAEIAVPANEQAPVDQNLEVVVHLPLSDQATFCFLKNTADTSVMGLLTLSTLYATYLLAWGKSGSVCTPKTKVSTDLSWIQIGFGSLPFAVFPIALYVHGIVQAAETDRIALGIPATLCLIEFIAAIALGGGMMFCLSGWLWLWCVAAVIVIMVIILLLTWGLTFKYPKGLRSFIWSTCFRQAEIVIPANDQALEVVVDPQ